MRAPAHRKRRLGSGRGERPAMGSLAQKVDTLREQLGLVDGRPLAASVDEAVFQLGLADQVKGFNLVQKADACLTALGTPSASAAAAPVAPSASAAAARDVLIGLPVGAAQAPMEIGRTAEESGTYTQPAVAPAPQPIAAPEPLQAKPELNPKSNPNPNPSPGPNPSPSTPPHPRPNTHPHAHPNRSHAPLAGSRSSSTA